MSIVAELLVIATLILANAILAGAEIAVISVRKTRLRELAAEGQRSASVLLLIRSEPETFFATVQIGITVVSTSAAAIGGARVARALAVVLTPAIGEAYADDLALAGFVSAVSFLSIVFGELVPKSLALRGAERYALLVARPLFLLARAMRPLVWVLTKSSNLVLGLFRDRTTFSETRFSKEELQQLVDEAASAGEVDSRAGEIAYRALDFGDIRVSALMVPRPEMILLSKDAGRDQIRSVLAEHWHARFPVHQGTPDEIVGYVTSRDLIELLAGSSERTVGAILREALYVPTTTLATELLRDMQRSRDHLALVVDEQGSICGLVTLEDLLEELVGEIFAEHETPIERIRREPDGAVVRGRVPVHEVNRELGLQLPESSAWSTMGGLATALAGMLPSAGTTLDAGHGTTLEVLDASERKVQSVRIRTSRAPRPPRAPRGHIGC